MFSIINSFWNKRTKDLGKVSGVENYNSVTPYLKVIHLNPPVFVNPVFFSNWRYSLLLVNVYRSSIPG